jgi:hypothetical protein
MESNFTPEVFIDFVVMVIVFIAASLTYIEPKVKKIRSLFFIRLGMISFGIFFLLDGLSIVFLSTVMGKISALTLIPISIFFIVGINYIIKESYNSILLIIVGSFGTILTIFSLLPDSVIIEYELGYFTVNWAGYFLIMGDLLTMIPLMVVFYWGLKTYFNSPVLIKREAKIFFIGIILTSPLNFTLYMLSFWNPITVLIADLIGALGALIFSIAILREPKLLYILPFNLYRILVKDRRGSPLFDYDWSQSNINETIFTGFINAVQVMSKEIMDLGGLLDINLEKGLLIVHESGFITVGLISSKSSKLLKESLLKFSADFEKMFESELKQEIRDPKKYEGAYELIEKYFSNFPYGTVTSRKKPLFLAGKYPEAFLEFEDKMKDIFTDEEEYKLIKSEIQKAPFYITPEFISLYDELKEEMNKLSTEEKKQLEEKNNANV